MEDSYITEITRKASRSDSINLVRCISGKITCGQTRTGEEHGGQGALPEQRPRGKTQPQVLVTLHMSCLTGVQPVVDGGRGGKHHERMVWEATKESRSQNSKATYVT